MGKSAPPVRVLILDGSPAFVAAAADFVDRLPGCVRTQADVVLIDVSLAGLEMAHRVKQGDPSQTVIALALFPTPELLAEAARLGIDAVVSKEAFAEELPGILARMGAVR